MFKCLNWTYGWSPPWLHHKGKKKKTHMVDTNLFKSTSRQIEWRLSLQLIFPIVQNIYIGTNKIVFNWLVTMIGPCGNFTYPHSILLKIPCLWVRMEKYKHSWNGGKKEHKENIEDSMFMGENGEIQTLVKWGKERT